MGKKKLLIISTQLGGGCFHYANGIIRYASEEAEIVLPDILAENNGGIRASWTICFYNHNAAVRLISFLYSICRILIGLLMRRYSVLMLFGLTKWDYYYMRLWKISRLPSYVVIHDGKMHCGEENEQQQKLMIQIMKGATHLIFLSNYVRNLVKDNFGIDKPYIIAPHGLIDYGGLPEHRKSLKPTLLFVGRISKYKGVELLLDAIKQVPAEMYEKLIIAGKWAYNAPIDYNHEKISIIDKWLSGDEILEYIAQSDIIVFPYIEATQSGVATLAINYEKPSIVTKVGAFAEQFTDETAIFINPDSAELAKAITSLLSSPAKYERMKNALKKHKEKYSWKTIAANLQNDIKNHKQFVNNESTITPPQKNV